MGVELHLIMIRAVKKQKKIISFWSDPPTGWPSDFSMVHKPFRIISFSKSTLNMINLFFDFFASSTTSSAIRITYKTYLIFHKAWLRLKNNPNLFTKILTKTFTCKQLKKRPIAWQPLWGLTTLGIRSIKVLLKPLGDRWINYLYFLGQVGESKTEIKLVYFLCSFS